MTISPVSVALKREVTRRSLSHRRPPSEKQMDGINLQLPRVLEKQPGHLRLDAFYSEAGFAIEPLHRGGGVADRIGQGFAQGRGDLLMPDVRTALDRKPARFEQLVL